MKLTKIIPIFLLLYLVSNLQARKLFYLEEFYWLYYEPHRSENQDYLRNIYWLRSALKRPWAPPIHALTPPKNEKQYQRYQKLVKMHLRYLIVKNTVLLAARFDKHQPVFYNKPFSEDILKSLAIGEYLYRQALEDWQQVMTEYQSLINGRRVRVNLEFLERVVDRIRTDELNYQRVIERRLVKISASKKYFELKDKD